MKLERLSDIQIRCTLEREDLSERRIHPSELTYGNAKTRELFHEMLARADYELNFHAEDIPLMIEAIPLANDRIMLLITKISEADELDTRFAKFSPSIEEESANTNFEEDLAAEDTEVYEGLAASPLVYASPMGNAPSDREAPSPNTSETVSPPEGNSTSIYSASTTKVYCFPSLDAVIAAAVVEGMDYTGVNTLYKDEANNKYYLLISCEDGAQDMYFRICNRLSEYADTASEYLSEAFLSEHFQLLVPQRALQLLKDM